MLDDLSDVAPQKTMTELRGLLGCFLFSEDDVFKPIGVLSGGERNRYALARMLLHPSNFLLLDEPTNHLDMRAKDVLLESLEKYNGTVVFVSHDRYFIDKLATRVFEIGDGRVEVFPGNYEDYLWRKQRAAEGEDVTERKQQACSHVVRCARLQSAERRAAQADEPHQAEAIAGAAASSLKRDRGRGGRDRQSVNVGCSPSSAQKRLNGRLNCLPSVAVISPG